MNYGLSDDQESVISGLEQLLSSMEPPLPTEPLMASYAGELQQALAESGFLDIAREDGFSLLDAALITERLSRLPHVLECGVSSIIAPGLDVPAASGPIALAVDATKAARYLPVARTLLTIQGDDAVVIAVDPANVEPVETLFAYPYGRLKSLDGLEIRKVGDAATLKRRWRIALALEAAGSMAGGLALIIEHVKTRQAFGRPLGAFQAIQHRLAMAAETTESTRWLALRAAWSDSESDAAIAAGFAQGRIAQITYDLHQFAGAMGLTLEFPLHYWTYRLRALAGELGGASMQARAAAAATWADAA